MRTPIPRFNTGDSNLAERSFDRVLC